MKLAYILLLGFISLNLSTLIAEELEIGAGFIAGNVSMPSDLEQLLNQTALTVEENPLLAPIRGFQLFLKLFRTAIWGFPDFITGLGAPPIIVKVVNGVWAIYWTLFLIYLLTGREIE